MNPLIQILLTGGGLVALVTLVGLILKKPSDAANANLAATQSYSQQLKDLDSSYKRVKADREEDRMRIEHLEESARSAVQVAEAAALEVAKIRHELLNVRHDFLTVVTQVRPLIAWIDRGGPPPPPDVPASLRDLIERAARESQDAELKAEAQHILSELPELDDDD